MLEVLHCASGLALVLTALPAASDCAGAEVLAGLLMLLTSDALDALDHLLRWSEMNQAQHSSPLLVPGRGWQSPDGSGDPSRTRIRPLA